jgi:hypothetical protein
MRPTLARAGYKRAAVFKGRLAVVCRAHMTLALVGLFWAVGVPWLADKTTVPLPCATAATALFCAASGSSAASGRATVQVLERYAKLARSAIMLVRRCAPSLAHASASQVAHARSRARAHALAHPPDTGHAGHDPAALHRRAAQPGTRPLLTHTPLPSPTLTLLRSCTHPQAADAAAKWAAQRFQLPQATASALAKQLDVGIEGGLAFLPWIEWYYAARLRRFAEGPGTMRKKTL